MPFIPKNDTEAMNAILNEIFKEKVTFWYDEKLLYFLFDNRFVEIWKNSFLIDVKIFYSSCLSLNPQKYYYVSKTGYKTLTNGKHIERKNIPDSLIDDYGECAYMWLKGKRNLFFGECTRFEIIRDGSKPGLYSIKGDKKEFIRPLTEEEKKRN